MQDQSTKQCNGCGEEWPVTEKFFHFRCDNPGKEYRPRDKCRACRSTSERRKQMTLAVMLSPEGCKACSDCWDAKPDTEEYFRKRVQSKDTLKAQCRECEREMHRDRWYRPDVQDAVLSVERQPFREAKRNAPDGHKPCLECLEVYPETEKYFQVIQYTESGLGPRCRVCSTHSPRRDVVRARMLCPDELRICVACLEPLPPTTEYFYTTPDTTDGLFSKCKACHYAYTVAYKQTPKAKAQATLYNKRRYAENKEAIKAGVLQWGRDNPEKKRAIHVTYMARKAANGGECSADEIRQMYADQDGLCAFCEAPLNGVYSIDHMIPVSKGGGSSWDNVAIVCSPCNSSKRDKRLEDWIQQRNC